MIKAGFDVIFNKFLNTSILNQTYIKLNFLSTWKINPTTIKSNRGRTFRVNVSGKRRFKEMFRNMNLER